MKLYFDTFRAVWLAKYPQFGSATGWSDFVVITREDALHYIEKQYEITYI